MMAFKAETIAFYTHQLSLYPRPHPRGVILASRLEVIAAANGFFDIGHLQSRARQKLLLYRTQIVARMPEDDLEKEEAEWMKIFHVDKLLELLGAVEDRRLASN